MDIIVPFGSIVYGKVNKDSDRDFYRISEQYEGYSYGKEPNGDDYHYVSPDFFQKILDNHDIAALEVYAYSNEVQNNFKFNYSSNNLRKSISGVVSNSWVKAKKKIKQGDDYIGRKSMWHSLRILMFGIQIANYSRIVDFSEANQYYDDIVLSGKPYNVLVGTYKPIMNAKQTEFRQLVPKTWS